MTEKQLAAARGRRRLLQAFLVLFIITVVGLIIYGGKSYLPSGLNYTGEDFKVEVDNIPDITSDAIISFKGSTSEPSKVELFLDDQLAASTATTREETWISGRREVEDNAFKFRQVPLRPGLNRLKIRAESLGGQTAEQAELSRSVQWTPSADAAPSLWRTPVRVKMPQLKVAGSAYPKTSVILSLLERPVDGGLPEKSCQEVTAAADENGHFEAELTFPSPGNFFIFPHYKPGEKPTDFSGLTPISFDPLGSRRAAVTISYDHINVDAEITQSKDDPAVADLLSGRKSLAQYINEQLNLNVGESPVAFYFRESQPRITVDDSRATVTATGVLKRTNVLPVLGGTLSFTKGYGGEYLSRYDSGYPLSADGDSVAVKVEDFVAQAYNPAPASLKEGVATWTGRRDNRDWYEGIQINLGYDPLSSPGNLLRVLTLSPYEIFNRRVSSFLTVLFGFLFAIPVLWMLWLLDKYPKVSWIAPADVKRFRYIGILLLAIMLVPSVNGLSVTVAGIIFNTSLAGDILTPLDVGRPLQSNHPLLLLASCIFGITSLSFLLFLAGLASRRPAVHAWVNALLRGYFLAALVYIVLCAVVFSLMRIPAGFEDLMLPAMLIVFPILLLIVAWGRRLYKQSRPGALRRRRTWLLLLLVLVFSYPVSSGFYTLERIEFPTWEVTQSSVLNFFSTVQGLIPYLFLLVILPFLKFCPEEEEDTHGLVVATGLLMFSAYVIGTTENWFIIPIPFLLALKLYPKLARQPLRRLLLIARIKARVFSERPSLLTKIFRQSQAQQFVNSLDQVGKKVTSGDLTLIQFIEREGEIEGYASEAELDNQVVCGLTAKDVVLSFGPYTSNWDNGLHAVKFGLIIALPFLLLFGVFLVRQIRLDIPFLPLWVGVRLFTFVMDWLVSAFFFGYFFTQLRGESGLKKGLNTAVTVIICFIPVWLMSGLTVVELSATFLRAGQIFLFFTILGVWAFDYFTFRRILREKFTWRKFTHFGDMPSFTAVASVLLTSASVAISTAVSGQFTTLVSHIVSALFPQLPASPSK